MKISEKHSNKKRLLETIKVIKDSKLQFAQVANKGVPPNEYELEVVEVAKKIEKIFL